MICRFQRDDLKRCRKPVRCDQAIVRSPKFSKIHSGATTGDFVVSPADPVGMILNPIILAGASVGSPV